MALSLIISRLQNNGLILSMIVKFKILIFTGLTIQKFCSSWMITYIVRQERDRTMKFEIQQQEYIVILLLNIWSVFNGVFFKSNTYQSFYCYGKLRYSAGWVLHTQSLRLATLLRMFDPEDVDTTIFRNFCIYHPKRRQISGDLNLQQHSYENIWSRIKHSQPLALKMTSGRLNFQNYLFCVSDFAPLP
jgi:hypothetical protein